MGHSRLAEHGYTRFEDFAERLHPAVHTVLAETENDRGCGPQGRSPGR